MAQIQTFPFEKAEFEQLRNYHFGLNWPVVYLQEDGKEMYIGQTTNVYSRSKQHFDNPNKKRLKRIHVVTDEEFNMSSAYDFESLLIQYVSAEGLFKLQNGNGGLINHNYYEKEKYLAKLETIWPKLQEIGLVKENLIAIKNSEFFKYSPYKALTEDQLMVANQLVKSVATGRAVTHVVNGGPGTGKSILALYLLKYLKEDSTTKHLKVGLVVPMTSLRSTLERVLRRVPGLGSKMIIGPSDVAKQKFDLILVDEAHRLQRRVNITNFKSFDDTNKKLGLKKESTQLDWILKASVQQIFFYDERQSIRPADVRPIDFSKLKATHYELVSQMRIEGGGDYLRFVDNLLELKPVSNNSETYDFRLYDDIHQMVADIRKKNSDHSLARVVAGYAWPWRTRNAHEEFDIEIDGLKMVWNRTNVDWVNSSNAINEVGCIHTVQGYDLNYAGVIIGPELSCDEQGNLVVDQKKYEDFNGKRSITHPDELQRYIINIYKTLMTRGIKGTYVYAVDDNLREKLKMLVTEPIRLKEMLTGRLVKSPITLEMLQIPLVGSAPCGNPLLGEENIEEYISVEKSKIRPGSQYFIVRAEGDSMDLAGIKDGNLLLCRYGQKPETGDRVVALLGGENVTIKFYDKQSDLRILLPKSSNKSHMPIMPEEGDSVQGIVQEILE